ncbi:MAG: hypothetical protein ACUVXI_13555 [bacterium]
MLKSIIERVISINLFLIAAIMVIISILGKLPIATRVAMLLIVGGGALVGGTALWRISKRDIKMAEEGELNVLRNKILNLARLKGGTLTVTEVAEGLQVSMEEAEKAINSMVDDFRVEMKVRNSGVIAYEFPEIMERLGKKAGG